MKSGSNSQNKKAKTQVTAWIIERMPQIVLNSSSSSGYEAVLINLSSVIADIISENKYLKDQENEFILEMEEQLQSIIIPIKPQKYLIIGIDGVLPLQKVKTIPVSTNQTEISPNDLLPGTQLCIKVENAILKFAKEYAKQYGFLNIIYLGPDMPGEALYKLRFFIVSQKNKPGFCIESSIFLADSSDQGLLSILALHLPRAHLRVGSNKQILDIGILRQLVITEFSLLNNQGQRNYETIIDDFILLALLCGADSLPRLSFFDPLGMTAFFYLYKRMYPFLNGSLSSNGIIYQTNLHIFFHELGIIEDTIACNKFRRTDILKREESEGNKFLEIQLDALIKKSIAKANLNANSNQKSETLSYKSFFSGDKKKLAIEQTLKKASFAFRDCIADANKYGERFFEGVCEDDDSDDENIQQFNLPEMTPPQPKEGERGFKEAFYLKTGNYSSSELPQLKTQIQQKYFEGIVWHFASYFREYPSWLWEYNYDFAPFAEDMRALSEIQISFSIMPPLSNSQQLIVLYPASSSLPRDLIDQVFGETSTLKDLFPKSFVNGQLDTRTLNTSEIEKFFQQLARFSEFVSFSKKVDKPQKFPILIAHKRRFSELTQKETLEAPEDTEKSFTSKLPTLLSIEKHNISGEVSKFIMAEGDTIMLEADVTSTRLPIVPIPSGFVPLSEKQKEIVLNTLTEIHSRAYNFNYEMQSLERCLSVSVDANEVFNRGIINQIQYPILKTPSQILPPQQKNLNNNNNGSGNNQNRPNSSSNSSNYSRQSQSSRNSNFSQQSNNQNFQQNQNYNSNSNSNSNNNNNNNSNNNNSYNGNNNYSNPYPQNNNFSNNIYNNNYPPQQYHNQQQQGRNYNNSYQDSNYFPYDNNSYGQCDNSYNHPHENPQYPQYQNQFQNNNMPFNNGQYRGKGNSYEPNQGDFRGNFQRGPYGQNEQGNINSKRHLDQRHNQYMNSGRKQFQYK